MIDLFNDQSDPFFDSAQSDAHRQAHGDQYAKSAMGRTTASGNFEGVITEVFADTHSYTVTPVGHSKAIPCGRLLHSPSDCTLLDKGLRVLVSRDSGYPMILGILPTDAGNKEDDKSAPNVSGTQDTGAYNQQQKKGGANFRNQRVPRDLGPGDQATVGEEGNIIGALAGGDNIMRSGMAEVSTSKIKDTLMMVCQRLVQHTNLGVTKVEEDGGMASYTFRGGADMNAESGPTQENWTIRFDLGAAGDLFHLELTKPDGATLFKFHVNADGKAEMFAAKGIDFFSGTDNTQKHLRNRETVVKGTDTQTIEGNQSKALQGDKDATVSGSETVTVGNDRTVSAVRHETKTVGGNLIENVVGGNPLVAKPTNVARETNISNGSWDVDIGNPLSGGAPAALAGYNLSTFSGDINHKVRTKGNITQSTVLGNVELSTRVGNAALKSNVGYANVDAPLIYFGPLPVAQLNPVIKGTQRNLVDSTFLGTNLGLFTAANIATGAMMGTLAGPQGFANWSNPGVMVPAMTVWLAALTTMLTGLAVSHGLLIGALPSTLSTRVFTA